MRQAFLALDYGARFGAFYVLCYTCAWRISVMNWFGHQVYNGIRHFLQVTGISGQALRISKMLCHESGHSAYTVISVY